MTMVKICGLTNLEDARHAWQCGADLLGFIFVAASPRCVTVDTVSAITSRLRDGGCTSRLVGVTADLPAESVLSIIDKAGLDAVQLHGHEDPAYARDLKRPVILAHRVRDHVDWSGLAEYSAWAYLLDGYDPARLGGTGRPWRWDLVSQRPEGFERVIVAGGLTPDNVTESIRQSGAWGVDVSSGVELAPGRKDHAKVARFIASVRELT
jgi:phosphoribosylanthranilate isomerase